MTLFHLNEIVLHSPIISFDGILAHARNGSVLKVALCDGAAPWVVGSFKSFDAGVNRGVVTERPLRCKGQSFGLNYLVAVPGGLEAVSLVDGECRQIYKTNPGETLAVFRDGTRPQSCCGVATRGELVTFVVEAEDMRALMALRLNGDGPVQSLLQLSGQTVAGPLMCADRVLFCTDRQAGLYDARQGGGSVDFPVGFAPFMSVGDDTLNLVPDAMPLALPDAGEPARKAIVFGRLNGRCGMLEVNFDRPQETVFKGLSSGSSLATMADGTAVLCINDGVQVYGASVSRWIPGMLRRGMPAFSVPPFVISFEDYVFKEKQRLRITLGDRNLNVEFESEQCTGLNCCGAYGIGSEMAVAFFDVLHTGEPNGLYLAHWRMGGHD